MASGKSKTIDEIDDVSEMIEVMKALDISWKGLESLDQMKSQVKMKLSKSVETPSWTPGQVRICRNWLPNKCECQSKSQENSKSVATVEKSISLLLCQRECLGK